MKNNIERTLFWFSDGENKILSLNDRYFSLGNLCNRLLNENYIGKKIKFINIFFRTEETYKLYPRAAKHYTHFHQGHLSYDDVFDLASFSRMTKLEQDTLVWNRSFEILKEASEIIENRELFKACELAYNKGIEIDLNPNFRMIEKNIVLFDNKFKAEIWVIFKNDGMYSKFTLELENEVVYEKYLDKAKNGVEFFLEIYNKIELKDNDIIVKGHRDVDYLPIKILVRKEELGL